jgi:oxygen-independent coproporphyrinogen-3 oxidase
VSEEERRLYINELCREILTYKSENKISVDTIFFGGGTPSLLSEKEFSSICDAIYESFEVAKDTEFTVEVNPKTLKPENLAAYVSCGVNRISIGLQTIHDNEYKILGRIHNFEDFITTYNMIRDSGITNINVDLMYGIPEQTESTLGQTLDAVLSLRPTHISAYGLILEEGTPLWRMKDELVFPDGDEEFFMYSRICETLRKFGYYHYEISNYSYPGYECRHNMKYWNSD